MRSAPLSPFLLAAPPAQPPMKEPAPAKPANQN